MVATVYAVTGLVGQLGYANWHQLVEMQRAGFEIGNHSATHPDLSMMSRPELEAELGAATGHDAVGELVGFHNRYSYTGGNPVNRVDRNGMCWTNASASSGQQDQCRVAWDGYTEVVTETYTRNWPRDVRILMTQEARYWSGLSYNEFMNQWNSSRPPVQSNNLREYAGYALGGAAVSGGPGIEDALFLIGAACLFAASMTPSSTIALPMRQPYYFTQSNDDANSRDDAIPVPVPRNREDDDEQYIYKNANRPKDLALARARDHLTQGNRIWNDLI